MTTARSAARVLRRGARAGDAPVTLGVLGLVLLAAYGNVVFRGETLVSTANFHPFDYRHPSPGTMPANWHDQGANWWQWEPAGQFFSRAFRGGAIPEWDPTLAAGLDAHVNVTQGQYFPPYALLLLLGNGAGLRDAYHLLLLLVGGLCCVALARGWGMHRWPALVMGVAYVLSGAVTFNVNSIIGQAIAMIPLPVLALDRLLDRPTPGRVAAGAAAVTAFVLTSFMPVVLSGLVLLPFLLLARVLVPDGTAPAWRDPDTRARAFRFTGALALGLAGAAFLLVPAWRASQADPRVGAWYAGAGLQHSSRHALPTLVSPVVPFDVNQGVTAPKRLFLPLPHGGPPFWYVGLLPLMLAVLASGGGDRRLRRGLVFLGGAGGFVFLKLMGVPPASWIGHLPVLSQIHFLPYFQGALAFCVAGLAALGAEQAQRRGVTRTRILALLLCCTGLAVGLLRSAASHPVNLDGDWVTPGLELLRLVLLGVAAVFVVRAATRGAIDGRAAGAALLGLVALELAPLALRDRDRRADVWARPPAYVQFLLSEPSLFRVHAPNGMAMTPNVNQGLGLSGIGSRHAFNVDRYQTLVRRYFGVEPLFYPVPVSLLPRARVILDLMNVKYVVMYGTPRLGVKEMHAEGFTLESTDGDYQVYRNRRVWPRAYIAARARVVATGVEALEALAAVEGQEVVLEAPVSERAAGGKAAVDGGIRIVGYEHDRVDIRTRTRGPAVVVLSDTNAPGWTATVNGERTRILAANYAFRAVEVPGGPSRIVFEYRTPGLRPAVLVSVAALLAMAGLGAATSSFRERFRRGYRRFIGRS